MTSDKLVDNKTGTTSISFGETLLGGNLCCFYYLAVVKRNHLDPRQCPIRTAPYEVALPETMLPIHVEAKANRPSGSRFAALGRLRAFPASPKFRDEAPVSALAPVSQGFVVFVPYSSTNPLAELASTSDAVT
jgi:hypothetical protein